MGVKGSGERRNGGLEGEERGMGRKKGKRKGGKWTKPVNLKKRSEYPMGENPPGYLNLYPPPLSSLHIFPPSFPIFLSVFPSLFPTPKKKRKNLSPSLLFFFFIFSHPPRLFPSRGPIWLFHNHSDVISCSGPNWPSGVS